MTAVTTASSILTHVISNLNSLPFGSLVLRACSAGSSFLPVTLQLNVLGNESQQSDSRSYCSTPSSSTTSTALSSCQPSPASSLDDTCLGVSVIEDFDVSPNAQVGSRADRASLPSRKAQDVTDGGNALGLVFDNVVNTEYNDCDASIVSSSSQPTTSQRSSRQRSRPISVPTWQPAANLYPSQHGHAHPFDPRFSPPARQRDHTPRCSASASSSSSSSSSPWSPNSSLDLPPTPPSPLISDNRATWDSKDEMYEDDDDEEYFRTPPMFPSGPGSPSWASPRLPTVPPPSPRHNRFSHFGRIIRQRPTLPVRDDSRKRSALDDGRGRSPKSDSCGRFRRGRRRSPPRQDMVEDDVHRSPSSRGCAIASDSDDDDDDVDENQEVLVGQNETSVDDRFIDIKAIRRQRSYETLSKVKSQPNLTMTLSASPSPPPAQSLALVSSVPDWTAATMHRKRSKSLFFGEQWRMYALGKDNERRTGEGYWRAKGAGWVDLA
ncbi:hypothetical protein OIO90_003111 [Microbotryomycetes sp. JL221]|nr:hypothetical protein OIO90_003111 [Microbotryomycetes sp. JL221]